MVKKVEADFQDEAVSPVSRWLCGIDVGRTITAAAAINLETGAWRYAKALTTRPDSSVGVQNAVRTAVPDRTGEGIELCRATTLATNALIERRGAVTGLVTTRGFGDFIDIGRETRYDIYDLKVPLLTPLVPSELRFEIDARGNPVGSGSRRCRWADRGELRDVRRRVRVSGLQ
ncbi:hydantoinase/oxoprolinase N-terminal domain-containing protein [Trinickia mobilis]|uniref:hydantoinase/oxoprolinase N-terminal domain-containing protein n=1 Tax=Trinickia mobilis TaxID=2816356 RepID=UPI001A8CB918|nr:hydantoinase/oxoprolinase N-terminal domain-containing protein [Trinickia mobilis]